MIACLLVRHTKKRLSWRCKHHTAGKLNESRVLTCRILASLAHLEVTLRADSFTFLLTHNSKLNIAAPPRSLAATTPLNVRVIADSRFIQFVRTVLRLHPCEKAHLTY